MARGSIGFYAQFVPQSGPRRKYRSLIQFRFAGALWMLGLVVLAILAYAIVKPFHLFGNWFDAAVLLSFIVLLLAFRWQSRRKGKAA